ncbi:MAG: hypothetical protein AABX04_00785 [Nanoarchaeota archaeon]
MDAETLPEILGIRLGLSIYELREEYHKIASIIRPEQLLEG